MITRKPLPPLLIALAALSIGLLAPSGCSRPEGPHGFWDGNRWDNDPPAPLSARDSLYFDVEMLMSPAERDSWRALPDAAACEGWLLTFWEARDPSRATPENERREEHFARLAYARANFPRVTAPYFDARGRDYVLFGRPDRVLLKDVDVMGLFYQPRRETWVWNELGQLAEYEDFFMDGNFQPASPEAFPLNGRNRLQEMSTLDAPFDNSSLGDPSVHIVGARDEEELQPLRLASREKMESMRGKHREAVEQARVHSTDLFQASPLWAVFAVDCFRGAAGKTSAELSYQFRIDDLVFLPVDEGKRWEARFRQSLAYLDSTGSTVSKQSNEIRLDRASERAENSGALFAGLMRRELAPGDYHLSIQIEDLQEGPLQIFDTPVSVPDFRADTLRISDITFASSITRSPTPELFRRGEWNVFPHPLHSYSEAYPLHVYFEIYGLQTDERGENDYRLSYRIRRAPERRDGVRGWLDRMFAGKVSDVDISASLGNMLEGEFSAHPLIISAAGLAEGVYLLEIEVADTRSGARAARWGSFSVTNTILPIGAR